jgi:hypothetical protein
MANQRYKIDVVQSNGTKEAIIDYAVLEFEKVLNELNWFRITLESTAAYDYTKFTGYEIIGGQETGIVYIYKEGTLDLAGIVDEVKYDSLGRMVLIGYGMELKAAWKSTGNTKTFASQNLATTVTSLMGDLSSLLSLGTNNSFSGDPLGALDVSSMSYLDALRHAVVQNANHDLTVTYSDAGLSSLNNVTSAGSGTSIGILVDDVDIKNIQRVKNMSQLFNKVDVIGKNEGDNMVTASAQDATSQSKYGVREPPYPIVEKRLTSTAAAQDYADAFISEHKDPIEEITFDVVDVDFAHALGDAVTIRSKAQLTDAGAYTRDVRIVKTKRTITSDKEILEWTVTQTGKKTKPQDIVSRIVGLEKQFAGWGGVPQFNDIIYSGIVACDAFAIGFTPLPGNFMVVYGTDVDFNGCQIHSVANPTAAQDVATKDYVDDAVGGGGLWESAGAGLIKPITANTSIIPNTSGNLGQNASPTWNAIWLNWASLTESGGTILLDSFGNNFNITCSSAGSPTFTIQNTGAGAFNISGDATSVTFASALLTVAQLMVNGSAGYQFYVSGTAAISSTLNVGGNATFSGHIYSDATTNTKDIGSSSNRWRYGYFGTQVDISVATGTAPLVVLSTTKVTNLNADYLDGYNYTDLQYWEYVSSTYIRPVSSGRSIIPNTSGDLGQNASPTWGNLWMNYFSITGDGSTSTVSNLSGNLVMNSLGNLTVQSNSASTKTLTVNNIGAGVMDISGDAANITFSSALLTVSQINVNGSGAYQLYVAGTASISGATGIGGDATFSGHLYSNATTNTKDIGASGNRFRTGYFGTSVSISGSGTVVDASSGTANFAAVMINGSAAYQLYVSGTAYITSTVTLGGSMTVSGNATHGGHIYSNATSNTKDVGSSGTRFRSAYFGTTIYCYGSGTALDCSSGLGTFSKVNVNGSSAIQLYVSGTTTLEGGVCTISYKLKIPVGTNLY